MIAVLLTFAFLVPATVLQSAAQDSNDSVETSSRWLLSFKHSVAAYETYNNPRFLALLREGLPHYAVPWYRGEQEQKSTLPYGAAYTVSAPGSVTVQSDRFVTINGYMPRAAGFKGLLWCDTGAEDPTMIFVFMNQHLGVGKSDSGASTFTQTIGELILPCHRSWPPPLSPGKRRRRSRRSPASPSTMRRIRLQRFPFPL
jgi:hypothetical protein